jgi:hypothetical protein
MLETGPSGSGAHVVPARRRRANAYSAVEGKVAEEIALWLSVQFSRALIDALNRYSYSRE